MSTLVSNTKSTTSEALGQSNVSLTITGVDSRGQMFRHTATVLQLEGRRCVFTSKSEPEVESSILAEFDYPQAHPKNRVTQALVRSRQLEMDTGLHTVTVELEIAQTAKVVSHSNIPAAPASKPALEPAIPAKSENKGTPAFELCEPAPAPAVMLVPQTIARAGKDAIAPAADNHREAVAKFKTEDPLLLQTTVKSAVAAEINQQMGMLKGWLSTELEKALVSTITPKLEKLVEATVDRQLAANSKTTLESLNADVARQVGERIAESKELRATLEAVAKDLFAEQSKVAQAVRADVEQELTSRAGLIVASLEGSITKMEARIIAAPSKVEDDLNARAASIIQGFEASVQAIEAEIRSAPQKIGEEAGERSAALARSLEEKATALEVRFLDESGRIVQEMESRAAVIAQSCERLEALAAVSQAKIDAAPLKIAEELNTRAAAFGQYMEKSVGEVDEKIKSSAAKVEDDLISRTSMILRSFEDSLAEVENKMGAAPARIERQLNMRASAIIESFEALIAEKESRINLARSDAEAALSRLQRLRQEVVEGMLPIQKSIDQLKTMEQNGLENMQSQFAAQLRENGARFESELLKISADRAAQLALEIEARIEPQRKVADETVEKMGAVLQLIQGTARAQQERLNEHAKAAAINFEKEVRALLLRLANGTEQ